MRVMGSLLCLLILTSCVGNQGGPERQLKHNLKPTYWPTKKWRVRAPETQGIDSAKLAAMLEYVKDKAYAIDSITVIRNGYIVLDAYPQPFFKVGNKHILHSATKSVISALIGIAIDRGFIKNIDLPVYKIFSKIKVRHLDANKKSLTIKHLLTMSTGMRSRDNFIYGWHGFFKMKASANWRKYALNLPLDVAPGQRFEYSNISSFLLSAIIHKTTKMSTLAFAKKYLFKPLGIKKVFWNKNKKGIHYGWGDLWLKPQDMAKIGFLYLNKGKWGKKQIISKKWVIASTQKHSRPKNFSWVREADGGIDFFSSLRLWLIYNFDFPYSDGYGYQWWLGESGIYSALGFAGQFITVIPSENMVVVFTAALPGPDFGLPEKLTADYILPAIVSSEPVERNEEAWQKLKLLSKPKAAKSIVKGLPELPKTAKRISRARFKYEEFKINNMGLEYFLFDFKELKKTAKAEFGINGRKYKVKIGLDNKYRFNKGKEFTSALRGRWLDETTFALDYQYIGFTNRGTQLFTFKDGAASILFKDDTMGEFSARAKYSK